MNSSIRALSSRDSLFSRTARTNLSAFLPPSQHFSSKTSLHLQSANQKAAPRSPAGNGRRRGILRHHLPQSGRLILAGAQQRSAIGRKVQGQDQIAVAFQRGQLAAVGGV